MASLARFPRIFIQDAKKSGFATRMANDVFFWPLLYLLLHIFQEWQKVRIRYKNDLRCEDEIKNFLPFVSTAAALPTITIFNFFLQEWLQYEDLMLDELKRLMMSHGGIYHHYYNSAKERRQ